MKELLQLVSAAVAAATSPEVALAAVVGWFGHVFWTRHLSRRRKPNKPVLNSEGISNHKMEEDIDVVHEKNYIEERVSPPSSVVESGPPLKPLTGDETDSVHETISADEVSPARLVDEIITPILRELSILANEIREKNLTCAETIRWNGARRDGTTWYQDQFTFDGFPEQIPQPSVFVEVSISVHIKSVEIPPKLEILDWRGYFRSENSKIYGVWEKFPAIGPNDDSIPAYNLDSLISDIRADVDAVTKKLQLS